MRYLRVLIKKMGWAVKDADAVLRDIQISSMQSAAGVISKLGGAHPAQWPDLSGRVWRKLEEVQLIRHRLAHGFDTLEPSLIRFAGQLVLTAIEHRDWLELVPIKVDSGAPFVVGDLLARQVAATRQTLCDEASLRAKLQCTALKTRKSLPSGDSLRDLAARLSN